ncbi:MAG: response regulator [Nitrospirales bacterium]|nr:response regulator [Nitrospirales bacterium]
MKEKTRAEADFRMSCTMQGLINDLLTIALQSLRLEDQLRQMTAIVLYAPIFPPDIRGGIFLSHEGSPPPPSSPGKDLFEQIIRQYSLLPGESCFYGQTSDGKRPAVSDSPDGLADLFSGLTTEDVCHVIPVRSGAALLGSIVLCHQGKTGQEKNEEGFLRTVSQVIATLLTRKRHEEEISSLSSRLNAVVEHIPQGTFLLDGDQKIIHANRLGLQYLSRLCRVKTGDRLTHLLGRPLNDFLVSPLSFVWHEVETEEPNKRIFEIAGKEIPDGRGTVFVMRDVTEEKTVLEKVHSQERLAAVGQMAAGIAHDFNNFLSTIIGYADFLLMTEEMHEEMKTMVETIAQSGRSASTLIKQILDFSRKAESEMSLLDLKPFVKEFTKLIRELIPENIRISYTIGDGHYLVEGDLTKIKQMLMNLAINARDAMPEGGILNVGLSRLRITGEPPLPLMPLGEWITLCVADTGAGIPPDVLPHIYEPFFTTKEPGIATGLGLSQVYGVVKQHNGFINVRTEEAKGTMFTIYLPPAKDDSEIPMDQEDTVPKGNGQLILVVEDDNTMRVLVSSTLSSLGYSTLSAQDGKEGISIFAENIDAISLVITDLMLPEKGGIELCIEMQKKKAGLPVLGMTGYDPSHFKGNVEKAGFRAVLIKPFSVKKLSTTVAEALGSSCTRRGAGE